MTTPAVAATGQEPTPNGQVPQGAQEPKQPETPAPPKPGEDRTAVLEAELKRARQEAAQYRTKAREAAEQQRKAAEDKALSEGKFKEVAEQREQRAKELETELEQSRARLAAFEAREAEENAKRATQVDADFAQLPESIRARVPADDLRAKEIAVAAYREAKGQAPRPPTIPNTAPKPAGSPPEQVSGNDLALAGQTLGNPYATQEQKRQARAVIEKARAARKSP